MDDYAGRGVPTFGPPMTPDRAGEPQTGETARALDRMERTLPQYVDMSGLHWWPCTDVREILMAAALATAQEPDTRPASVAGLHRYTFVPDTFDALARMDADPDGEWLRYEDVAQRLREHPDPDAAGEAR